MFENIEPLNTEKHQDLKLIKTKNYDFAKGVSIAPLSYSELIRASRYYPIVFSSDERAIPKALLSIRQGENSFVDQNGNWLVPYVPVHIRRYPFILAKRDEEGNFAVCIEPSASNLSTKEGEPLYTANGEPTDTLNRTMEFLRRYHQEMANTESLFAELQDKDILVEKNLTIGRGDQEQATIGGFRVVETEKLNEVGNDTLGDWVKRGIMGLIYAHLHSLDNMRELAGRY